ncbi:hypothetical protein [Kitasatospora sp. NPDC087314]|uniref:hypothetical protein n=1 Tax=Kitasatospora sp. NPDC087314 TaxID=3364068 RepID=UPI0038027665
MPTEESLSRTRTTHATHTVTFHNTGDGKIWLETPGGTRIRLWTQADLRAATPTVTSSTNAIDRPVGAEGIARVCADVDEYDRWKASDYLARGSKDFTGNSFYTLTSADGSVTIGLTIGRPRRALRSAHRTPVAAGPGQAPAIGRVPLSGCCRAEWRRAAASGSEWARSRAP